MRRIEMPGSFQWLFEEENREVVQLLLSILSAIGITLSAFVVAGWTIFKYMQSRKDGGQEAVNASRELFKNLQKEVELRVIAEQRLILTQQKLADLEKTPDPTETTEADGDDH